MIPLTRVALEEPLARRLACRTDALRADLTKARRMWKAARAERAGIREHLERMAAGLARCMYCGDNQGTDIDHFQPIAVAPIRAFDWHNRLLACGHCNSRRKGGRYPCDDRGSCLLIDPCREDPYEHLRLRLADGRYRPVTRKGEVTIDPFDLNRAVLRNGRANAAEVCREMVLLHIAATGKGDLGRAARIIRLLREQPFADVIYAMPRAAASPGAAAVLGGEAVVAALSTNPLKNLLIKDPSTA